LGYIWLNIDGGGGCLNMASPAFVKGGSFQFGIFPRLFSIHV